MTQPSPRRGSLILLLPIFLIVAVLALLFAWVGGWFGGKGVTPQAMANTAEASGSPQPGFRRAHSKGICIAGTFAPTPAAAQLSTARVFSQASTPVLGRFPIQATIPMRPTTRQPCAAWRCSSRRTTGRSGAWR